MCAPCFIVGMENINKQLYKWFVKFDGESWDDFLDIILKAHKFSLEDDVIWLDVGVKYMDEFWLDKNSEISDLGKILIQWGHKFKYGNRCLCGSGLHYQSCSCGTKYEVKAP